MPSVAKLHYFRWSLAFFPQATRCACMCAVSRAWDITELLTIVKSIRAHFIKPFGRNTFILTGYNCICPGQNTLKQKQILIQSKWKNRKFIFRCISEAKQQTTVKKLMSIDTKYVSLSTRTPNTQKCRFLHFLLPGAETGLSDILDPMVGMKEKQIHKRVDHWDTLLCWLLRVHVWVALIPVEPILAFHPLDEVPQRRILVWKKENLWTSFSNLRWLLAKLYTPGLWRNLLVTMSCMAPGIW